MSRGLMPSRHIGKTHKGRMPRPRFKFSTPLLGAGPEDLDVLVKPDLVKLPSIKPHQICLPLFWGD